MSDERQGSESRSPGVTSSRGAGPGSEAPGDRAAEPPVEIEVDLQAELHRFATELVVLIDSRGELLALTDHNVLGYDVGGAGHQLAEHVHPDDLPALYDVIERARRTPGLDEPVRLRARDRAGRWHLFDGRVFEPSIRSALRGTVLRLRDVTDEAAAGPIVVDRFSSLAELLPLGILSADTRGWVAFTNAAAQTIFGLPGDALAGHGWELAVVDVDRSAVVEVAERATRSTVPHLATFRIRRGPSVRWVHARFGALVSPTGAITGWIATVEDITERRMAESALAHRATHDSLTGLPNRALLEDRLRQACRRLRRGSSSVTVLFLDLDGFKAVNDRYGHRTGDLVLVEVANRLRGLVRQIDTVARLGGDEFVAVCESLPVDEADHIVSRIAESLAEPVRVGDVTTVVGASVGVVTTTDASIEVTDLLELADQAMYRAKGEHRGQPDG